MRKAAGRWAAVAAMALAGVTGPVRTAGAQEIDTATRLGALRIVELDALTRGVALGDRVMALPGAPYLAFVEARLGDLFLIALSQGGNACPAEYVWLHAVPGDVRFSEVFGTCSDLVEVSHDADTVRVTMPSFEAGKGDVTFIYDGKGPVRTEQADVAPSGMASWDDWGFWDGQYPYDMAAAADMRPRFVALMGVPAYGVLLEGIALAGPMDGEGDWIAGQGMRPHDDSLRAAVALNTRDGRLLVALWQEGAAPVLWGRADAALPGPIAAVMALR